MAEEKPVVNDKSTTESTDKNEQLDSSIADLIDPETKKNKKKLKCLRCDSYILQPMMGVYQKLDAPISMPSMRKKKELAATAAAAATSAATSSTGENKFDYEAIENVWLVCEMMTFENVGFTNTVDNKKYLICADCEIGPLGLQNLDKPNEFLVCIDRVKHV